MQIELLNSFENN